MKSLAESGIFRTASDETLNLITHFNTTHQHTLLIPTRFISSESGQVGYLLDEYFNWNRDTAQRKQYRTFFTNSRFEALYGAIKIVRQHWHKQAKAQPRNVFICDPTLECQYFIDPLGKGDKDAFIPGINVCAHIDDITQRLDQGEHPLAVVICATPDISATEISDLFRRCRQQNIFTIFEDADLDLTASEPVIHSIEPLPDVIVTGESLTDYEIPGGAFSMTTEVHKPWATMEGCSIHSSTYAGNRLTLTKMRETLLHQTPMFESNPDVRDTCARIEREDKERLAAFARYINPGMVKLYRATGLDVNPVNAHGSRLTVRSENGEKRDVFDCVAGGGAVYRGHSPEDLVPEVLAVHDLRKDYWADLQQTLSEITSLPRVFPSISGAIAVDLAMSLALLAQTKRTKVVTFTENYAGKSLLSLIGTADADEWYQKPFIPLYHDVVYVDAFAPDAEKILTDVLTSGTVALLWFEIYQGGTEREIPAALLEIIARHKEEHGYLIGVDEILMGFFRSGKLFTHTGTPIAPDIMTIAKVLSDGTFPMGATLVSEEIYQKASERHPAAVRYYEKLYINQLGSHIGLHCLNKIFTPEIEAHAQRLGAIFEKGLREICQESPFIKKIDGRCLSYRLHYTYDNPILPVAMLFWCFVCLQQGNTFLFFDRFGPPAFTLTEEEAHEIIRNLRRVFCEGTFETFGLFLWYVFKVLLASVL